MHRTNAPSSHSSSTPAASTLRPRTRRLISIDDEFNAGSGSESGASAFASRTASPIPRSHPSRPSGAAGNTSQTPNGLRGTPNALTGGWWTTIQEIATNVLGNEEYGAASADTAARKRKPFWTLPRTSSGGPPKQWGPSAPSGSRVGAGTQDERESQVRALKRRDMLNANGQLPQDAAGRVKRRNSDDHTSSSAPPAENEDTDALVYIHHVRPQDTLAGVTIKYNCAPAILRKANRMWPNDSIQTKKVVVLPVDACGVKGRRVAGPDSQGDDLLQEDYSGFSNETTSPNASASMTENSLAPTVSHSSIESEHPWKHERWVLLPNDTKPTEIGRMPPRTLGFFPPARRKSIPFSDTSTASLDLVRSSISTDHFSSRAPSVQSPGRRRPSTNRTSSMSNPRGRGRSGSNSFVLHGPGGVGTMGKNVKSPGPGQDPLNKLFASHLPSVEPPEGQEYFTPWAPSLVDVDAGTSFQNTGAGGTPLGGAGMDLQQMGGAIEGWVRKVGSQASKLLSEPSTPGRGNRSAVPVVGAVGGDLGDLIELRDDAFEIEEGEQSRGRPPPGETLLPPADHHQSARPEFVLSMRDRARKGTTDRKTD